MEHRADMDIARHLRSVEWLKVELLEGVTELFKSLGGPGDGAVPDRLATIILTTYVLSRRLGVDFHTLDQKIRRAIHANAEVPHDFEEWFGDFSALADHFGPAER